MLGNKKGKLKNLPTLIDTVSPLGQDFTKTIKNSLRISTSEKYFLKDKLPVILKSDNFSSLYHVYINSVLPHRFCLHIPELRRDLAIKETVS
jgi:hypothetical protein